MSYDQRPGKLRVVQEHAGSGQRRGEVAPAPNGSAEASADGANPAALPAPAAKAGLPVLGAALFLLACAGGGIALAVIRPFGIW